MNEDIHLSNVFDGVRFDLIVASECMYYFTNDERHKLLSEFLQSMDEGSFLYANSPTYDTAMYSEYRDIEKNSDGMVEIKQSGSIQSTLFVNLPRGDEEMKAMYEDFHIVDLIKTDERRYSDIPQIEYHLLAQKR